MSNHLRWVSIPKPSLSADEVTSLIAFLFTLQYYDQPGDAKAGEQAFVAKGCVQCHEVGGQGGRRGPSLDFLKHANSPVLVAVALWNHGPEMAKAVETRGITRPTFTGKELGDIVAFIGAAAKEGERRARVGRPRRARARREAVQGQAVRGMPFGRRQGREDRSRAGEGKAASREPHRLRRAHVEPTGPRCGRGCKSAASRSRA